MKKFKFLVLFAFMGIVALSIGLSPTYANQTDLYDDATENQYGGQVIELLENSSYEISIVRTSTNQVNDFTMDLGQGTFSLEVFDYDGLGENFALSGDSNVWESYFVNQSWTIETGSTGTTLEIAMWSDDQIYDSFAENYDIKVIWLGNTEPVDNVAPEYTYSQASVDTPYYDLVTVSEIQSQLQAVDDEEGDVTSRIQVYEDHYTSVTPKNVGDEYFVVFMVDDTSGNSAYLRVDINIIDDLLPVVENGQETYTDGAVIEFSWFNDAYSPFNDPVDDFINFTSIVDDYHGTVDFYDLMATNDGWAFEKTGDWQAYTPQSPGVYNLVNTATDPSGNTVTFTIKVTVLDNNHPVISGPDTLNLEAVGFQLNDVLNHYSASDVEDGSLPVEIKYSYVIEEGEAEGQTVNYDYSWATINPLIGSYSVYIKAVDSYGVETFKEITLNLVDTIKPVIKIDGIDTNSYTHTVYMSDTSTLQALIDGIVVTDTYDGTITNNLVVPALPSFAVPNTHNLQLQVSDSSGNTSILNLQVIVADDIPPVVNGAIKIVKGLNEVLTLSDIKATLTVTDNIDNNLELELVSDAYTGNSGNVGSYLVKYKVTDLSNNVTYHNIRVWVVDNQAPAWILNDYFINLGINESMTRSELVSLLQSAGMIGSDISYTVTFLTDEYTGNETIEGAYSVVMNITYENGSEEQIAVEMNVPEPTSEDVIVVTPDENLTGLQSFIKTVKNIISSVWNGVKSVFDFVWNGIIVPVYEFIFVRDEDIIPNDEATTLSQTSHQTTDNPSYTLPYTPTTGLPVNEL